MAGLDLMMYKDGIKDGKKVGREEGILEGREKGREEGKIKELVELVVDIESKSYDENINMDEVEDCINLLKSHNIFMEKKRLTENLQIMPKESKAAHIWKNAREIKFFLFGTWFEFKARKG